VKSQKFPGKKTSDLTYSELMLEKTELNFLADTAANEENRNKWLQKLGYVLEQLRERRAQRIERSEENGQV
jgi:hypothetical protein